jgi:hypothetical protein
MISVALPDLPKDSSIELRSSDMAVLVALPKAEEVVWHWRQNQRSGRRTDVDGLLPPKKAHQLDAGQTRLQARNGHSQSLIRFGWCPNQCERVSITLMLDYQA